MEYFREKTRFGVGDVSSDLHSIYVFKPNFFENLMPIGSQLSPEYMTYNSVSAFNPELKGRG